MRIILLIVFLSFAATLLDAQDLDSLKLLLQKEKTDSTKVKLLNQMVELEGDDAIWPKYNEEMKMICEGNLKKSLSPPEEKFYLKHLASGLNNIGYIHTNTGNYKLAFEYYEKSTEILEGIGEKELLASFLINIATVHSNQGNYHKAIDIYSKCLKVLEGTDNKKNTATCLNNLGTVYRNTGNIPEALNCFLRCLKLREETNDKTGLAFVLYNLGELNVSQEDLPRALEYYEKSIKLHEEAGDKRGAGYAYHGIGSVYGRKGDSEKALEYFIKALKAREEVGDKFGISNSLEHLGDFVYREQKDYKKAMSYFNQSLKLREELGDKNGLATLLESIGKVYRGEKNYAKAIEYGKRSYEIASEVGNPQSLANAAKLLSGLYYETGKFKESLDMYVINIKMGDSTNNMQTRKANIQQQMKYEYEKKASADSIKVVEEKKITFLQLEQEKNMRYVLYGGLALVLVFAGFMFNRFQISQKQKNIISLQKNIVEEKQKEILDSITYAKRIQEAILPAETTWKSILPDSFVLYKPKDIVAGDFYWLEKSKQTLFFAVGDCTGHGVPGALVSVVCGNALNRALHEFGMTEPGKVLDKTREIVISTFEKSDKEVKDGMDISLCSFNPETQELKWAGANNPLWYISKGEFQEIRANKQPIGKGYLEKSFATHKIVLNKGDMIYLLTDGYADQFGGPWGKKFKNKTLKELLLTVKDKTVEEQQQALDEAIMKWKGTCEQVDDICVVGIRVRKL
jgi:tetratricopeptide (TPR) repeat protein/serine phosphatase RsbU (regulator of sigma subunit)